MLCLMNATSMLTFLVNIMFSVLLNCLDRVSETACTKTVFSYCLWEDQTDRIPVNQVAKDNTNMHVSKNLEECTSACLMASVFWIERLNHRALIKSSVVSTAAKDATGGHWLPTWTTQAACL